MHSRNDNAIWIRGVPHYRPHLEEIALRLGGNVDLILDPRLIARLDALFDKHKRETGQVPTAIVDEVTHDRFIPVIGQLQTENFPVRTRIYFRIKRVIV